MGDRFVECAIGFHFGAVHGDWDPFGAGDGGHFLIQLFGNASTWSAWQLVMANVLGSRESVPARRPRSKPYPDPVVCSSIPFLPHCDCATEGLFASLNQPRVERPFRVIRIACNILDDLPQAATNAGFLNGEAEFIEVIAIGELTTSSVTNLSAM